MSNLEFSKEYYKLYIELAKRKQSEYVHIDTKFGSVYIDSETLMFYISGRDINTHTTVFYISFNIDDEEYYLHDGIEDDIKEKVLNLMREELLL